MDGANGLEELASFVHSTTTAGVPRQALLLRTDRLPASLSRAEQLRHARAALDPLSAAERVRWHHLPGGRIVVSWKGEHARLVDQAMEGLRRIAGTDPLDAPALKELVEIYDLPVAGDMLLKAATTGLSFDAPRAAPQARPRQAVAPALQPLGPAELDRLEHSLRSTDMSRFARRRPVSHYDGQIAQLAWEERTLSVPELIDTVAPGRDAKADIWLFRRLTRVLDRRMLSILSDARELRGAGPFSITLNVASVLSPEFLRFDAALPSALRGKVLISVLPVDVASDAGAFAFACSFARERSYRICLRAVSCALLPALDLTALDLDFIQLVWSVELLDLPGLPDPGRARWIMGQPCTQEAATWGLGQGITLFSMKPTG